MNTPRIAETPAGTSRRLRIPPISPIAVATLAVALGIGFAAGRGARPATPAAPHAAAVVDTPAARDSSWSRYTGPATQPTWALAEARRVLGPDVVDAVMYIDKPSRRYIVALTGKPHDDGGLGDNHPMVLLAEEGGTYRRRDLPLEVANSVGHGMGLTAGGIDGAPDAPWVNTGRLWGVDDVDGDGTTDIWAGDLMESARGIWNFVLAVYHPATGRSENISYTGDEETRGVREPEGISPGVTHGRLRDWLLTRGVLLAHAGSLHDDGWQGTRPYEDAEANFRALRAWGWNHGQVPRIEVPYLSDPREPDDTADCTRGGIHFRAGSMLWRDELRRRVTFPVYASTTGEGTSMAIGRRYLWMAETADSRKPARMVVYDIRDNRLLNVPIAHAPPEQCGPGYCELGNSRFTLHGDTLYLGSVPFQAPDEYGGAAETRGAVICGEDG